MHVARCFGARSSSRARPRVVAGPRLGGPAPLSPPVAASPGTTTRRAPPSWRRRRRSGEAQRRRSNHPERKSLPAAWLPRAHPATTPNGSPSPRRERCRGDPSRLWEVGDASDLFRIPSLSTTASLVTAPGCPGSARSGSGRVRPPFRHDALDAGYVPPAPSPATLGSPLRRRTSNCPSPPSLSPGTTTRTTSRRRARCPANASRVPGTCQPPPRRGRESA